MYAFRFPWYMGCMCSVDIGYEIRYREIYPLYSENYHKRLEEG